MRARMKPGVRSIVLHGYLLVPEYPTYWTVTEDVSAAVELLAKDGQVEFEPSYARGGNGAFVPAPALQLQPVVPTTPDAPTGGAPTPFARKASSKGR